MRVSDKAIVLQTIRHGDKKLIVKLYTRHHGILTTAAVAGKSAASKIKPGSVLPLTFIDVQYTLRQNKEVHQLTEASCYSVHPNISTSMSRLAIAQFLNEVLIKVLKEQSGNPHLFGFIEASLRYLNDTETNYNNLHLYFLSELTKYLGFEPQNNYGRPTPFFDCREGQFTALSLAFPLGLNQEDSRLFSEFLKVNSLNASLSYMQRQTLLEILLVYYRLHIPGFNEVKSLQVLKEVLSS